MDGVSRTRVGQRTILFGISLLGTLILVAAASVLTRTSDRPSVAAAKGYGAIQHYPPLAGGVQVTLAQARSMTGVPALLPQTSLASNSSIEAVWARRETPDMLVMYQSGVGAEVRPWSLTQTPNAHWNALMSDGLPGLILTLNGQDMYVIPPGGQGGVGSVNFVTPGGTWVTIYGDGTLSARQLQDAAASASAQASS